MAQVRAATATAVRDVITCEPDYLIMGMSSETFWGGRRGNAAFQRRILDLSGLRVATGASACERALAVLGVRRVGVVTPYPSLIDAQMRGFLEECDCHVIVVHSLKCASAVAIAQQDKATLRRALLDVNRPEVEAIVQFGTNLSMLRLADEAERWLGKPVIAINAATFWHALRENDIPDRLRGFGCLLREH